MRIPAWKGSFDLVKRELEMILEREVLPTIVPEFPIARRMTLGMNSSLMVPSLYARAMVEKQQKEFKDGWDLFFIGYTAAVYFYTCDIKIYSWTTQAKRMRGSLPPKFEVRDILRTLDHWANTATPPLASSTRKNLELPLSGETCNMGMILLSAKESKKNTFEGNKWIFLSTLDEKTWLEFLSEFNQKAGTEATLESFKEDLWDTVVKFGELALMGTGLDEKARKELLDKMIKLRETEQKTKIMNVKTALL